MHQFLSAASIFVSFFSCDKMYIVPLVFMLYIIQFESVGAASSNLCVCLCDLCDLFVCVWMKKKVSWAGEDIFKKTCFSCRGEMKIQYT
jgi:hypothetical protein